MYCLAAMAAMKLTGRGIHNNTVRCVPIVMRRTEDDEEPAVEASVYQGEVAVVMTCFEMSPGKDCG